MQRTAGTATHGLDYRKSAGGFIHGFRYSGKVDCCCWYILGQRLIDNQCIAARALHRHLEWRYHQNPWPSLTLSAVDLTYHLMKRINEASVSHITRHTWYNFPSCRSFQTNQLILKYIRVCCKVVCISDFIVCTSNFQGLYQMFGVLGDVMLIR